jgi:hypothetical protein
MGAKLNRARKPFNTLLADPTLIIPSHCAAPPRTASNCRKRQHTVQPSAVGMCTLDPSHAPLQQPRLHVRHGLVDAERVLLPGEGCDQSVILLRRVEYPVVRKIIPIQRLCPKGSQRLWPSVPVAGEEVANAVQAQVVQELSPHRRPLLSMRVNGEQRTAADGRGWEEVRAEVLDVVRRSSGQQREEGGRELGGGAGDVRAERRRGSGGGR